MVQINIQNCDKLRINMTKRNEIRKKLKTKEALVLGL